MKPYDSDQQGLVRAGMGLLYGLTLLVCVLLLAASLGGIFYPFQFYPSAELREMMMANDVVNLLICLPVLLGSLWYARRGRLAGLLVWPGALLYVFYNYLAYTFALPLNWAFLFAIVLVPLSAYTLIGLLVSLDGEAIRQRLAGRVPERVTGGLLVGFGVLFGFRVIGMFGAAILNQTGLELADWAASVADIMVMPAWVTAGILLWRKHPFGYVSGAALLYQGSMLFLGLILFLLLQPLITGAPLAVVDILVLSVMALVFFYPLGVYLRAVLSSEKRNVELEEI